MKDTEKSIEVLIKALGTMVLEPKYKSDPGNIGVMEYVTSIQKPILEGEARVKALAKMADLIDQL